VAKFFSKLKAPAVLKHGILRRYVRPFAVKTGSRTKDNRVVIVDAYAGAGRYEDGQPGSPEHILKELAGVTNRSIRCYFVEANDDTYSKLAGLLDDLGTTPHLTFSPIHGPIEDHIDDVVQQSDGASLFVFLDPLGFGLPADRIRRIFELRPAARFAPATEVLMRVDCQAIYRTRGALLSTTDYAGKAAQLAKLDATAGGDWWREGTETDTGRYLEWFAQELFRRLRIATGTGGWVIPVRDDPAHLPSYYLLFLTRHQDGIDVYSECLSSAQEDWRKAVFLQDWDATVGANNRIGQFDLFGGTDPEQELEANEEALAATWNRQLASRLEGLLAVHGSFVIRDYLREVLGDLAGLVRPKHIRKAILTLADQGIVDRKDSVGDVWSNRLTRLSPPGAGSVQP
jgi:three-Cys-motif partner protein